MTEPAAAQATPQATARQDEPVVAPARPGSAAAEPGRESAAAEDTADVTPGGLPRRRSRRTDSLRAAEKRPEVTAATSAQPVAPPDSSFTGLAAFATAGRETDEPHTEESD
ncbi:hypothetical protein [Streptomyces sp. MZ04]|uniref:hypothetical protein n=1 Tax=Streptomyces sp. MZ04 TaxID=2559236 RepID=UPI0032B01139